MHEAAGPAGGEIVRKFKFLAITLVAAAFATSCVFSAVAASRRVAARMHASASPAVAVPGEHVRLTAVLPIGKRSVELRRYAGHRWVRAARATSNAQGRVTFVVSARAGSTRYQAYSRAVVRHVGTRVRRDGARKSSVLVVKAVRPTAKLSLLAAPVAESGAGVADLTPAAATFTPARAGRRVAIQKYVGGRWVTAASGVQSRSGTFAAKVAGRNSAGALIAYRAVTWPATGVPPVASTTTRSAGWRLAWSDEFAGPGLDTAKWRGRQVGLRVPPRRLCSEVRDANTTVSGGAARLTVTQLPASNASCKSGEYANAMIGTQSSYRFRYGFAAARVRFQPNQGQHGAFWLQTEPPAGSPQGNPATDGAEIDVAEFFGAHRPKGGLADYVHWTALKSGQATLASAGGELNGSTKLIGGKAWSAGYHVFSVEWTPSRYVFRVDGTEVFRTAQGISRVPEYLVLSLLSSDWELPAMDRTALPSTLSVDWVRVWQAP